jgi:hypothetical protein
MTKSWGPCTWYLFHSLAEKIKEESFNNIKGELLNIIKNICTNIPCGECSGHAIAHMRKIDIRKLNNKNDLKMMLWSFHNEVNHRLKKKVFTIEELNDKYSKAKLENIVGYFIQQWRKPSRNPKLMVVSLHKDMGIKSFINWWNNNYNHFNS